MRSSIVRFIILLSLFSPLQAVAVTPMLAAGFSDTLALKADGTVVGWGDNSRGQLGADPGAVPQSTRPIAVPLLTGVINVASGPDHNVATLFDGTVMSWGKRSGQVGELGFDSFDLPAGANPVKVPLLTDIVAIAVGDAHTVALKANGTVMTWGDNTYVLISTQT